MSSSDGFKATEVVLGLPFPITAIFCCNDLLGLGALQFLSKTDSKRNNTLVVLGYDNLEILDITSSKLNSVAQKPRDIGLLIADLFLELTINGLKIGRTNHNIILEPEVISRTKIDLNKLIVNVP
jgi:LacI family transcriptional regulator